MANDDCNDVLYIRRCLHYASVAYRKLRELSTVLLTYHCLPIRIRTGRLYSSCVRSSMLHGSETWLVRKENEPEVALQRAEMRMVRWTCNVKVKDTL